MKTIIELYHHVWPRWERMGARDARLVWEGGRIYLDPSRRERTPYTEARRTLSILLEITASPLVLPPNLLSQRMIVWANERKVGEVTLLYGGPIGFYVPPLSPEDRSLFIRIEHPDVWVPENWDRDLSIRFVSLRILSLVEPHPARMCQASGVKLPSSNATQVSDIMIAERLIGITIRELMVAFEALIGNCEFGGIQRLYGAEPLSLLRFSGITTEAAIWGLDRNFDGIGEDLEPQVSTNADQEWMILDRTYKLHYHTFVPSNASSSKDILLSETRKVAFLKRVFLENLTEDRKIYVCADRFLMPIEAALPPFLALNRHGRHRMLWVKEATSPHQAGTVEEFIPGLLIGHVSRFQTDNQPTSPRNWLTLLCNAWLLSGNQP